VSNTFSPGNKVIKKAEKDARNWGTVMDRENEPMFQKPGYLAVYFKRQVWVKPENLMHYAEWEAQQKPQQSTRDSVKNYWTRG
jgi:hypothetical protein